MTAGDIHLLLAGCRPSHAPMAENCCQAFLTNDSVAGRNRRQKRLARKAWAGSMFGSAIRRVCRSALGGAAGFAALALALGSAAADPVRLGLRVQTH